MKHMKLSRLSDRQLRRLIRNADVRFDRNSSRRKVEQEFARFIQAWETFIRNCPDKIIDEGVTNEKEGDGYSIEFEVQRANIREAIKWMKICLDRTK